jgi:hypothetical protein
VDSRRVDTLHQLLDLWVETRNADPKGEIILMPQYTGRASAIATDAGVTWGLGNDGVTGAKGKQWDIPCPNGALTKRLKKLAPVLADDIKESIYAEIVEHEGKPVIVQLRDGPKLASATGDYIPHADFKVENVILLKNAENTDLLVWEKRIADAPRGTVIVIPEASLSSHFAVHGIVHKHAVMTGPVTRLCVYTRSEVQTIVKVGDILQPSALQPEALKARDYKQMRLLLRRKLPFDRSEAPGFSAAVLHSMPLWGRERHLLAFRVLGALTMLRLLSAACIGEARHFYASGPGSRGKSGKPTIDWKELCGQELDAHHSITRRSVYDKALELPLEKVAVLVDKARQDLSGDWGNCHGEKNVSKFDEKGELIANTDDGIGGCSFGGPKWRRSAEVATRLGRALVTFQRKPNAETWAKVAARYNEGVACGHNGGKLLDKFCNWTYIDWCVKAPQLGFISKMAMETVILLKGKAKTVAEGEVMDERGVVGGTVEPPKVKAKARRSKKKDPIDTAIEKLDQLFPINPSLYKKFDAPLTDYVYVPTFTTNTTGDTA